MNSNCQFLIQKFPRQDEEKTQEFTAQMRRGDLCPRCSQGRMDYDGMLNLSCPQCGYTKPGGGGFT